MSNRTRITFHPHFGEYIDSVPEGDLILLLLEQEQEVLEWFSPLQEQDSLFRYSEGKWSLKEVLGHIVDTERIMSYRMLVAGRGDKTPLPRHHDIYVSKTSFDRRPIADLIAEFRTVRASTLSLVRGLTDEELKQSGLLNEVETTATAFAYFILGHAHHHLRIVRERYFPHLPL
ncbi:DinB family protein [Brevibacillus centrosporus]|uniref:DinB superfamily protein n=1 Tax=Brevibacillus centrosporus TaxID=54910 RepID=A0A1I3XDM1_9BACL|nr:DinB family protein [Brevibacillus centrosporus]SFK17151.1 DinB superfamily protein [Brevibacillus centrosporus]